VALNTINEPKPNIIDLLHIPDLILKLYTFIPFAYQLFPFNDVKIVSVLARVMGTTTNWRIIFSYFVDI
jgi:hypothetical protein